MVSHLPDKTLWDFGFHAEFCENNFWNHTITHNHFHNLYELYYLVENEVIYFVEDKVYLVKPGMVVVIPPNRKHATFPVNNDISKRYLIYLPEYFVEEFLKDGAVLLNRISSKPIIVDNDDKMVEHFFKKIIEEFKKPNGSIAIQKALIGELLVTLNGYYGDEKKSEFSSETNKIASGTISLITRYINDNFSKKITLETLSNEFFLNPSYISRIFKKKLNISFSAFLRNIRINKVMDYLKDTDYTITEIAQKTGFDSLTSLCRVFKKNVGMSPLRYRILYKNTNLE